MDPYARIDNDRVLVGLNWSHAFDEHWTLRHRFNAHLGEQDNVVLFYLGTVGSGGTINRGLQFARNDSDAYYNALDLTGHFDTRGLTHALLIGGDYYRSSSNDNLGGTSRSLVTNIFNPVHLTDRPPRDPAFDSTFNSEASWYGLYLQDQIELPYHLHALGGFRYDNADASSVFRNSFGAFPAGSSDDRVSPRGGLLWRPIPEFSIYGSYTENFGANNGRAADNQPLPPETAQQWEVGAKTELLGGRVTGTLAYFDLTKQNIAVPDPTDLTLSTVIGEAESRGVELDIAGEVMPGWRIIGAYSYLPFAEVTKDVGFDGGLGNQGKRLFGAPRHAGSLWNTFEVLNGDLRGLKLGAGVVAVGQREGNPGNTYQIPGFAVVNLLAGYEWKIGPSKLAVQLNVDNLFDKEYFSGSNSGATVPVGAPRTFLGSIQIEF